VLDPTAAERSERALIELTRCDDLLNPSWPLRSL
jgi:hypothetical protein